MNMFMGPVPSGSHKTVGCGFWDQYRLTMGSHKTVGVVALHPALVGLISDALGGGGLWGLALRLLVVEGVALGGGGVAGLERSGKVWLRLRNRFLYF